MDSNITDDQKSALILSLARKVADSFEYKILSNNTIAYALIGMAVSILNIEGVDKESAQKSFKQILNNSYDAAPEKTNH